MLGFCCTGPAISSLSVCRSYPDEAKHLPPIKDMAKNQKNTNVTRGKLRVFFAEFEGDDATIQEGLRAIATAVNRTFQQPAIPKPSPPAYLTATPVEDVGAEELEQGEGFDDQSVEAECKDARTRRASKRKPPVLSLIKDMDLHPDNAESLRDFYDSKQPKSQYEQIATFVYYMRKILELDGITPNHVFTCFKDVQQRPPIDLPQIIRNCAAKKGWVDTSRKDGIDITTSGENLLDHDLPRNGA